MVGGGGGEQLQRKRLRKSRVFRKVCPGHNQYPQNEKEKKWQREKERRKRLLFSKLEKGVRLNMVIAP